MGRVLIIFANLGAECHFSKIGCNEFSFPKIRGYQCNLPLLLLYYHGFRFHTIVKNILLQKYF